MALRQVRVSHDLDKNSVVSKPIWIEENVPVTIGNRLVIIGDGRIWRVSLVGETPVSGSAFSETKVQVLEGIE